MRLSVTDLEEFRRYSNDESYNTEAFIRRLRGQAKRSKVMDVGTALHRCLEDAGYCDLIERYRFGDIDLRFNLDSSVELSPIREMKAEKAYDTPSGQVTLVGKVDGINGIEVTDHKFTQHYDAEKYYESYQWRCYLDMLNAKRFVYSVFIGSYVKDEDAWVIKDHVSLVLNNYGNMAQEVRSWVERFASFVTAANKVIA